MSNIRYVGILLAVLGSLQMLHGRPQTKRQLAPTEIQSPMKTTLSKRHTEKRSATIKPTPDPPSATTTSESKERILNPGRGGISFGEYFDQSIIFQDSLEDPLEPVLRIDGPPNCANGSTFCEHFYAYPYGHLKGVLRRNTIYKELFGTDEPPQIANRVGGENEEFLCSSIERTVFPNVGKNKNNKWKYIINQGEEDGFVQGVHIETCRNAEGACNIIGELPDGYKTQCKQKYVYRRMLSVNDKGAPIPDTFQLPSSCCCSYRKDVEFLARFGARVTTAAPRRDGPH